MQNLSMQNKNLLTDANATNILNSANLDLVASTPLTNEETALYATIYTNTVSTLLTSAIEKLCAAQTVAITESAEKILGKINDKFDNFIDSYKKDRVDYYSNIDSIKNSFAVLSTELPQILKSQNESTTALIDAVNKTAIKDSQQDNPRLHNSLTEKDSIKWIKDIWNTCKIIGRRCNKDKQAVLFDIYSIVRANCPTIKSDYASYRTIKPRSSQISMCGHSDYYRPIIENAASLLHMKYYPENHGINSIIKSNDINSVSIMKTPESIVGLIRDYCARHNTTYMSAVATLFKELHKRCNFNIYDGRRKYVNSLGYKNCSMAYYVANNKELMDLFKSIVEE